MVNRDVITKYFIVIVKVLLLGSIITYCILLISGNISQTNKLSLTELGVVILVSIIIFGFDRISELSIGAIKLSLDKVKTDQSKMIDEIKTLRFAIKGLLNKYEFLHLNRLSYDNYYVKYGHIFFEEIKRLDSKGFIKPLKAGGFNTIKIENENNPNEFDLKDYMTLTDEGKEYLNIIQSLNLFNEGELKR